MRRACLLVIMLFFVCPVFALADSIEITCPQEVAQNSEFVCEITGNTSTSVVAISSLVNVSDDLKILNFVPDSSIWLGDGADGDIELFTDKVSKGNFLIGKLNLKAIGSSILNITLNSISFFDEFDKETLVTSISKTVNVAKPLNNTGSSDNTTKTVEGSIQNDNNEVTAQVKENSVAIKEENQELDLDSDEVDSDGQNNDNIEIYLDDILIENYNLHFKQSKFEYELRIKDESSLEITPVSNDINYSSEVVGNENLVDGSIIIINVRDNSNHANTYYITINKTPFDYSKIVFIVIIVILVLINAFRIINNRRHKEV